MSTPTPNGDISKEVSGSEIPAVVGINFGNSYASISVLNKVRNRHTICIELEVNVDLQEGLPDCIANEDGERQIATAIAFHGEEMVSS